jgi:hypothetical protein
MPITDSGASRSLNASSGDGLGPGAPVVWRPWVVRRSCRLHKGGGVAAERLPMPKLREIIRLKAPAGQSGRAIVRTCGLSRTVTEYASRSRGWPGVAAGARRRHRARAAPLPRRAPGRYRIGPSRSGPGSAPNCSGGTSRRCCSGTSTRRRSRAAFSTAVLRSLLAVDAAALGDDAQSTAPARRPSSTSSATASTS